MSSSLSPYNEEFYSTIGGGSLRSARVVVPFLMRLLAPKSVADVGCGTGAWLAAFREEGVTDVLGLDGTYVDRDRLLIPPSRFMAADLSNPPPLGRTFDLVMSLEVAEHLPRGSAEQFVRSLTAMTDAVFFSAAIPHQGGVGHVNEQWPAYWAQLFSSVGFVPVDALRKDIWDNDGVEWWYAQNALLFIREAAVNRFPRLPSPEIGFPRSLVHPKLFLRTVTSSGSFQRLLGALLRGAWEGLLKALQQNRN
jgi:SAM-dependent methyltransferase